MQNILNQNLQQYLNDKFNILNKTGTRNVALEWLISLYNDEKILGDSVGVFVDFSVRQSIWILFHPLSPSLSVNSEK